MTVADSMSAKAIRVLEKNTVLHTELVSPKCLKPKDCLFFMVNDANFACFHNSSIITAILLPC